MTEAVLAQEVLRRSENRRTIQACLRPRRDYFCYSVNPTEMGAIYFLDLEHYDDPKRMLVFLAKDLKTFLASLVADE